MIRRFCTFIGRCCGNQVVAESNGDNEFLAMIDVELAEWSQKNDLNHSFPRDGVVSSSKSSLNFK